MTSRRNRSDDPTQLNALIELAQREHRAGRLAQAAAAYRRILAIRPDIGEVQNDLGIVFAQQGDLAAAMTCFQEAIALRPKLADAFFNLGNVLQNLGRLGEAVQRYEQAIALRPDYIDAYSNLGIALKNQGQLELAAARLEQALALRPGSPDVLNNLGLVLRQQGRLAESVTRFELALALRPDFPAAHNNLGSVLPLLEKSPEALAHLERAIALAPNYAEAYSNSGTILWNQGRHEEAEARFNRALALRPDYVEAHSNLGTMLGALGRLDEAVAHLERAIALRPDYTEAHNNLAKQRLAQLKIEEAVAGFKRALQLSPHYADARCSLATCYLSSGEYELGWPEYEARFRLPGAKPLPPLVRWTGQPLAGRSLLLIVEQGLGDTIQFVRYARVFKAQGARVMITCQPALGPLLAAQTGWDGVFPQRGDVEVPRPDYFLPLLSCPAALGTTLATIPDEVPYLFADPELVERWRRELADLDGFKIGIVWQGSRTFTADRWRSIPLAEFAPLARLPGVRLVSLQKGFGTEQIVGIDFPLVDLAARLDVAAGPFMDTAAVIKNLDLVLAPDTSIGHLAGALGAPVWLALQHGADWRWLRDRDDSPWYPTARLFRQTTLGGWSDVFGRIAAAVEARRDQEPTR